MDKDMNIENLLKALNQMTTLKVTRHLNIWNKDTWSIELRPINDEMFHYIDITLNTNKTTDYVLVVDNEYYAFTIGKYDFKINLDDIKQFENHIWLEYGSRLSDINYYTQKTIDITKQIIKSI